MKLLNQLKFLFSKKNTLGSVNKNQKTEAQYRIPFFVHPYRYGDSLPKEQNSFYNFLEKEFKKGNHINIEGNTGYVIFYLRNIKEKNYDKFITKVTTILEQYREYPLVNSFCNNLISEYHAVNGNFIKAMHYYPKDNNGIDERYISLLYNSGERISLEYVIRHSRLIKQECNRSLSHFGKANVNKVEKEIVLLCKEYEKDNKIDLIEKCLEIEEKHISEYIKTTSLYTQFSHKLHGTMEIGQNGVTNAKYSIVYNNKYFNPQSTISYITFDEDKFLSYISGFCRMAENRTRSNMGLPLIGQGWISETRLFIEIKTIFSEYKVTQHEKLPFLGRQHLDIYIHELNLGIEYQGAQHGRPIDYFGGVDAYEKIQERDVRKKELCEQNNIALVYVYPDYDISNVIAEIENICANQGAVLSKESLSEKEQIAIQKQLESQSFRTATDVKLSDYIGKENRDGDTWLDKSKHSEKELESLEKSYLEQLDNSEHVIEKHIIYWQLAVLFNMNRKHSGAIEKCIGYCIQDIALFDKCIEDYDEKYANKIRGVFLLFHSETEDILLHSFVVVITKLINIYKRLGEYDLAISLCHEAINKGIKDHWTKIGFQERLDRLQKIKLRQQK